MPEFLYLCCDCSLGFRSSSPVHARCGGTDCSPICDAETGQPIDAASEQGQAIWAAMAEEPIERESSTPPMDVDENGQILVPADPLVEAVACLQDLGRRTIEELPSRSAEELPSVIAEAVAAVLQHYEIDRAEGVELLSILKQGLRSE
jgi:hypothetical protein